MGNEECILSSKIFKIGGVENINSIIRLQRSNPTYFHLSRSKSLTVFHSSRYSKKSFLGCGEFFTLRRLYVGKRGDVIVCLTPKNRVKGVDHVEVMAKDVEDFPNLLDHLMIMADSIHELSKIRAQDERSRYEDVEEYGSW